MENLTHDYFRKRYSAYEVKKAVQTAAAVPDKAEPVARIVEEANVETAVHDTTPKQPEKAEPFDGLYASLDKLNKRVDDLQTRIPQTTHAPNENQENEKATNLVPPVKPTPPAQPKKNSFGFKDENLYDYI